MSVNVANPELQRGDQGAEVIDLQQLLQRQGFPELILSGTFDADTQQAVICFQQRHHLRDDGVVEGKTWEILRREAAAIDLPVSYTETLYKGIKHPTAVKELQRLLQLCGYTYLQSKGQFDPQTKQAVMHFQSKNGLEINGMVDAAVWAILRDVSLRFHQAFRLMEVCQTYRPEQYPHQALALEWLQSQIDDEVLHEFARRWCNL